MVETITELPLPGRIFARRAASLGGSAPTTALPSFVAGPENRLVAAAINRLLLGDAAGSAPARRTSLFALHGPSGTGKTHLARGLVLHWQQRRGPESAEYLTAVDFRREIIAALDENSTSALRQRLRGLKLLAIDDLDRFANDRHLQEELRATLDALEESGGLVVVTSSRPAITMANLSSDIRSRLAAGLTLQLARPGPAARERLIEQTAAALGHSLSHEAAGDLAAKIPGTAVELFGALLELCSNASPTSGTRTISEHNAAQYLADRATRRPALREIISVVAKYYRVPQKVLKSSSRKQSAVYARATAIFLARELAGASYENIGKALGGRDHTTIMHNYRKIQRDSTHDVATKETLEELRRILLCR